MRNQSGNQSGNQLGNQISNGKCLCGDVQFLVKGAFGEVRYCHCTQCQRATGTAFSANAKVSTENFQFLNGACLVKEYEQKPGIFRAFCSKCGSPVYARLDADSENVRVRLGSFETVEHAEITAHVWVSSKAPWYDIQDTLMCYLEVCNT